MDDGSDQGTAWRSTDFDDSAWKSGPAPLGYGRKVATTVRWGFKNRTTTYFRTSFDVSHLSQIKQLTLRLRYEKGVAVYLNGHSIARDNLDDSAQFNHHAATLVEDIQARQFAVDPAILVEGVNCLVAEVHQHNFRAKKLWFELLRPSERKDDSDNREGPILIDEIQAVRQADDEFASGTAPKYLTPRFDVTPGVQAWVDGQANHGWLLQSGQEPWRFAAASETNSVDPQQLIVHFIPPRQLAQLVWQWTLVEDWSSPLPSKAIEWAQRCMRTEPKSIENRLALCVAAYRAGRFEQLLHSLGESGQVFGDANACDWYLRAMSHWQLGRERNL